MADRTSSYENTNRLGRILTRACNQVMARRQERHISMRTAAFALAIEQVAEAELLRGGS